MRERRRDRSESESRSLRRDRAVREHEEVDKKNTASSLSGSRTNHKIEDDVDKKKKKAISFTNELDDGYFAQNNEKEDEDGFADDELAEINAFLEEEEEEEETEEVRLKRLEEERRKRQEAIMQKYQQQTNQSGETVSSNGVSNGHHRSSDDERNAVEEKSVLVEGGQSTSDEGNEDKSVVRTAIVEDDLAREEVAVAQEERTGKLYNKTFDIFSSSPTAIDMAANGAGEQKRINKAALLEGDDPLLQSNWDDGEGYYTTRVGEVICDRYRVLGEVGKGVFSTAIKCLDVKNDGETVVLKIIRNNNIMRKASERELSLLQLIAQTDPGNKKHCVRLLGHMEHRNHVVLTFEALGMNLRETVKKFGKKVGINVTAVRLYARQLFVALRHLAELKIVHADIKPDNILVSEDLKQVKLCDFGSAFRETDSDNDPTPYLQSRFYRAPEVILGLPYDRMIDLWSIGCCLYELFTGHVMFAGRTNNEMLRLHMEFKGKIPNKVVKAHQRSFDVLELEAHFDSDFKFKMHDIDPVTKKPFMRLVEITSPKKDISSILLQSKAGADDRQMVLRVADVLEKCLILDPSKRVTVAEILKHPLFKTK